MTKNRRMAQTSRVTKKTVCRVAAVIRQYSPWDQLGNLSRILERS